MEKKNAALGFLFIFSMVALGFFAGGFLGARVFGSGSDMGWDQLADALGGMGLGVILGLFVSAVLVLRMSNRQRAVASVIALTAAILFIVLLRVTNERRHSAIEEPPHSTVVAALSPPFPIPGPMIPDITYT